MIWIGLWHDDCDEYLIILFYYYQPCGHANFGPKANNYLQGVKASKSWNMTEKVQVHKTYIIVAICVYRERWAGGAYGSYREKPM